MQLPSLCVTQGELHRLLTLDCRPEYASSLFGDNILFVLLTIRIHETPCIQLQCPTSELVGYALIGQESSQRVQESNIKRRPAR